MKETVPQGGGDNNSHNGEGWSSLTNLTDPDNQPPIVSPGKLSNDDFPLDQHRGESHNQDPYETELSDLTYYLLTGDALNEGDLIKYSEEPSTHIIEAARELASKVNDSGVAFETGVFSEQVNEIETTLSRYYSGVTRQIIAAVEPSYEPQEEYHQSGNQHDTLQSIVNEKNQSISTHVNNILTLIENNPDISSEVKDAIEIIRDSASAYDILWPDELNRFIKSDNDKVKKQVAETLCRSILSECRLFDNLGESLDKNKPGAGLASQARELSGEIKRQKLGFIKDILGYVMGAQNNLNASPKSSGSTNSEPSGSELEDGLNASPESSGSTNSEPGGSELSRDPFV